MNASTVFQRYMKQCFQENHDDFIVPYIDLKTSHIGNMRLALQRLQQHLVNKIKAKKCQLFKQEVRYFSRTVAAGGYRLSTNNIKSVTKLVTQKPRTLGEVRRLRIGWLSQKVRCKL